MLKLKRSAMKYKDANGTMQDVGAVVGTQTPDAVLSETSTNSIQNKVVAAKINEIETDKADAVHSHSWNDLEDKPFGDVITENEFLNTTLNFTASDSTDGIYFIEDFTSAHLVVGAKYKVYWNGEQYECVGIDCGGDYVYIGNQQLSPGWEFTETVESDEPFFIVTNSDFFHSLVSTTSGDSVVLSIMELAETVNKIDAKYIPDTIARTVDIPTDEHINELINAALGVIENGTY